MRTFKPMKPIVTILALLLCAALYPLAALAGEAKQPAKAQPGPKQHKLAATLETAQWGWLDPNEPPKLTVNSGDIVSVETMMHAHNKIQPGPWRRSSR